MWLFFPGCKCKNRTEEGEPASNLIDADPFFGDQKLQSPQISVNHETDIPNEKLSGIDQFEELFAKFDDLKMTASALPRNERLDYAENIANAFLNSLGGDAEDSPTAGIHDSNVYIFPDLDAKGLANSDDEYFYKLLLNKKDKQHEEHVADNFQEIIEPSANSDAHPPQQRLNDEDCCELGFPVLCVGSVRQSDSDSDVDADGLPSTLSPVPEFTFSDLRSLDDIEKEMREEELNRLKERIKATEMVMNEINGESEPSKRFKL